MNNNITEYLYRIKDNIKAVENGHREISIFDEIEYDFYQFLELIKLFMISERDSYYGYFMMNLTFKADFCSKTVAGIKLNTYPPVMDSNPLLLCSFPLKMIIFIICHEIEHIVLNHPAEMVRANPTGDSDIHEKFNLAADASVNDRLRYEIKNENRKFMAVPDGIILSETLKKMFALRNVRPLENYGYYFDLIKNKDYHDHEHDKKTDRSENDPSIDADEFESDDIITQYNCGKTEDHNWSDSDDADEITDAVKDLINASTELMDDEIRENMPEHYLEQVKLINEPPKISWKRLLKKYVGTITVNKKKTRTRLNRRQPNRYDLSGEISDKMLKITVAIDTSASVTGKEVSMIFNEIFTILAKRKYCITVIECDSEIQRVYTVRKPSDVMLDIAGRGGTAFTPVIKYINSDKYFRDSLLIYFTDGYGEKRIPRPLTYRNLWVITGSTDELSLDEPYGAVVGFEK